MSDAPGDGEGDGGENPLTGVDRFEITWPAFRKTNTSEYLTPSYSVPGTAPKDRSAASIIIVLNHGPIVSNAKCSNRETVAVVLCHAD